MNILSIGLRDEIIFIQKLETIIIQKNNYYSIDKIEDALETIKEKKIDFFVCDTKFGTRRVSELIEGLGSFSRTRVRGAYVGDSVSDELVMLAINSWLIDGIFIRPYSDKDFATMKRKYTNTINSPYFKKINHQNLVISEVY